VWVVRHALELGGVRERRQALFVEWVFESDLADSAVAATGQCLELADARVPTE
jgi:hypothetical protein